MSCEISPDQSADEVAEASVQMAEAGGFTLEWRTQTQNDFIWLLDRKLVTGQITPLQAKLAFRDYSAYLDAVQALENGSSNAVYFRLIKNNRPIKDGYKRHVL